MRQARGQWWVSEAIEPSVHEVHGLTGKMDHQTENGNNAPRGEAVFRGVGEGQETLLLALPALTAWL